MRIDCDDCVLDGTDACKDCIVTFMLDRPPGPVLLKFDEAEALRTLEGAGLAPPCRFRAG